MSATQLASHAPISSPYLSFEEAAEFAKVSIYTIRRMVEGGKIKAYRPVRGRVLIHREELDAHIRSSTAVPRKGRGIRR